MKKSGSKSDLNEISNTGSLQNSGVDLSDMADELARGRNSRTLTLRYKHPSLSAIRTSSISRKVDLNVNDHAFLKPDYIVECFESHNPSSIQTLVRQIMECTESHPSYVKICLRHQQIYQPIVDELGSSESPEMINLLLDFISMIFPLCKPEDMNAFVDCDLCFTLYSFMAEVNPATINSTVHLVAVLSNVCSYARDAMLSFGLHTTLIEIAKNADTEQLLQLSCDAIHKIFENPEPIDTETVMDFVAPMVELLSLTDVTALQSVIDCFVEMTNKIPSIVFTLYDMELYPTIIMFLQNEDLRSVTLRLIGNMSVAHPPQIRLMLEMGIFDILMQLKDTEYATCVYWIFSNMLESVPSLIMPLFTDEFIGEIISSVSSDTASVSVKMEVSYFLSTLIVFTEAELVPKFMSDEVTDLLVEMLGCGMPIISTRCIDTLIRFIRIAQVKEECAPYLDILLNSDVKDRLEDLISCESPVLAEKAEYLQQQLDMLTPD